MKAGSWSIKFPSNTTEAEEGEIWKFADAEAISGTDEHCGTVMNNDKFFSSWNGGFVSSPSDFGNSFAVRVDGASTSSLPLA